MMAAIEVEGSGTLDDPWVLTNLRAIRSSRPIGIPKPLRRRSSCRSVRPSFGTT